MNQSWNKKERDKTLIYEHYSGISYPEVRTIHSIHNRSTNAQQQPSPEGLLLNDPAHSYPLVRNTTTLGAWDEVLA